MTIIEINKRLEVLKVSPSRENILEFSFALLQWMNIVPNTGNKPQLLSPQTQKLKDYLVTAPQTVQPQLYRLSADAQNIRIRFAVLKKLKKEYINQLVDNDPGLTSYQAFVKGLTPIVKDGQTTAYIPQQPYFIHFVTTHEYDKLVLIFNQGEQKRIVSFRNKLTNTQYNKIIQQWQGIALKPKPEIADLLWKSLDIKEVNKTFYAQIKERFDALINILSEPDFSGLNDDRIQNIKKQFAVRFIGRYIFCWFLKEKNEIIPHSLISSDEIKSFITTGISFYHERLLKLFFGTLNTIVVNRDWLLSEPVDIRSKFEKIPYLNGGLFDDNNPEDQLINSLEFNINDWLIKFVEILESYDFTIDESSSSYQQVAIDPEMLGRIFENLLASQNEETSSLANQRKAFGAFYTPREIVDYMVNESLKAHLITFLLPPESKIENTNVLVEPLVAYKGSLFQDLEPQQLEMPFTVFNNETDKKRERINTKIEKLFALDCAENPFDKNESQLVRNALSEVKILDPACGSGAFPMGMLLRLMDLHQIVGHGFKNNYDLKSEILSRNIYGVDIMPMAVEIARLRAWLSLILEADYKPTDRKNNFGVSALPNLDFKFVCANSLIDSGYDEFLKHVHLNATLYRLDGEIQKLERLRDNYFDPKGNKQKKEQLQQEFTQTKKYITTEFASLRTTWHLDDFLNKVDDWDPFDDSKPSSFFSPAWMFGIREGFDVVIGNPPYVQMQKDSGKLAALLKNGNYSTFERTGDVYAIFYELGFNVLKPNGVHVFITSSQWLKANYGKSLRKLFLSKNPIKLIALGPGVFETAVVDTNIMIAKNAINEKLLQGSIIDKPEQIANLNALTFQPMPYVTVDNWAILNTGNQSINEKIKAKTKPLSEWSIKINFGIKTGYNEAFIIDEAKRNEIIKEDAKSAEIIKPVLRGREIEKYYTEWDGGYLVSTFPSLHIDISKYKTVKKYLEGFLPKIKQTGEPFINEKGLTETTRKKTSHKWFETQDPIGYYKELSKEKIIWKRIGSQLRFSYSENEIYCLDSTCIATGEKIKYLTALLNSKLCNYQLFESAPKTGMGDLIISVQALEPLLVYYPTETEQLQIEKLFDEIIRKKKEKQDTKAIEKEIDVLVYKLYELTYDEVKIIDKDFWLSEGEYENYSNEKLKT